MNYVKTLLFISSFFILINVEAQILKSRIVKAGYSSSSFMPFQEDSIKAILDGKDSLTILPTGGGKSLCYQLPALIRQGMAMT
jgi:superfamily II DNA helicase RecQ